MLRVGHKSVPGLMNTTLADWVPSIVPVVAVVSMKLLLVASSPSHKRLSRIAHRSDVLTSTAGSQQFHGKVLRSCMSTSTSSSGLCLADPATLGVGVGLQLLSPTLCNTTLRYFLVECDLSPVRVQHSLTHEVFILHAHFVHCPDFETDFLCEVGLDLVQRRSRSSSMKIIHVYLSENIQLTILQRIVVLRHTCRNSALQGVLR